MLYLFVVGKSSTFIVLKPNNYLYCGMTLLWVTDHVEQLSFFITGLKFTSISTQKWVRPKTEQIGLYLRGLNNLAVDKLKVVFKNALAYKLSWIYSNLGHVCAMFKRIFCRREGNYNLGRLPRVCVICLCLYADLPLSWSLVGSCCGG